MPQIESSRKTLLETKTRTQQFADLKQDMKFDWCIRHNLLSKSREIRQNRNRQNKFEHQYVEDYNFIARLIWNFYILRGFVKLRVNNAPHLAFKKYDRIASTNANNLQNIISTFSSWIHKWIECSGGHFQS